MKKNTITLSLTLILIIIITACSNIVKSDDSLNVGTEAPDFSLLALDGTQVKLADLADKVVLLFFFGNG